MDPRQQQQMPEMVRPIFISGKVMLEDGTPPQESVVIERVCNGNARPEGYTDSKGRFSFEVGRNQGMFTLRESGLNALFAGHTSIEEVVRETVLEDE